MDRALLDTDTFSELLKGAAKNALAAADTKITADTIAKFLFTSGSTGIPKGVITTHRMLNSNMAMQDHIWPFMSARRPVLEYQPGTWGPAAAAAIVCGEDAWRDPVVEKTLPC